MKKIIIQFIKQLIFPSINHYSCCFFTNLSFNQLKLNVFDLNPSFYEVLNESINFSARNLLYILQSGIINKDFQLNSPKIRMEVIERSLKKQYFHMNISEIKIVVDTILKIKDLESYESLI